MSTSKKKKRKVVEEEDIIDLDYGDEKDINGDDYDDRNYYNEVMDHYKCKTAKQMDEDQKANSKLAPLFKMNTIIILLSHYMCPPFRRDLSLINKACGVASRSIIFWKYLFISPGITNIDSFRKMYATLYKKIPIPTIKLGNYMYNKATGMHTDDHEAMKSMIHNLTTRKDKHGQLQVSNLIIDATAYKINDRQAYSSGIVKLHYRQQLITISHMIRSIKGHLYLIVQHNPLLALQAIFLSVALNNYTCTPSCLTIITYGLDIRYDTGPFIPDQYKFITKLVWIATLSNAVHLGEYLCRLVHMFPNLEELSLYFMSNYTSDGGGLSGTLYIPYSTTLKKFHISTRHHDYRLWDIYQSKEYLSLDTTDHVYVKEALDVPITTITTRGRESYERKHFYQGYEGQKTYQMKRVNPFDEDDVPSIVLRERPLLLDFEQELLELLPSGMSLPQIIQNCLYAKGMLRIL